MDAPETAGAKAQAVMGNTGGKAAGAGSPIDRQVGSARECGQRLEGRSRTAKGRCDGTTGECWWSRTAWALGKI